MIGSGFAELVADRRFKRIVVLIAPIAVFAIIYLALVAPRQSAARRAQREAAALRPRLLAVQGRLTEQPSTVKDRGTVEIDLAMRAFERRVPTDDRVSELLEQLAQLALDPSFAATDASGDGSGSLGSGAGGKVRNLKIDTGDRLELRAGDALAPQVASAFAELPDPRLALFQTNLAYSPLTVSFDATYQALGRFLWGLRDLPTAIEIRSLEVTRPAKPFYQSQFLHVELTLYAFQRVRPRT